MTTEPAAQALSAPEYAALTSAVLGSVEATTDAWLEAGVIDIDSHRTGGLLELTLPNRSKLIINTQPPLQELWLAAKAGGFHFKFVNAAWRDTKDGREFFDVLSLCASAQGGQALQFVQHPPSR
jgi:CyaY protein